MSSQNTSDIRCLPPAVKIDLGYAMKRRLEELKNNYREAQTDEQREAFYDRIERFHAFGKKVENMPVCRVDK